MQIFPNLKPVLRGAVYATDLYTAFAAKLRATDLYDGGRMNSFREEHGPVKVLLIAPPMADREGALIHPGVQILQNILRRRGISCEVLNYNLPVRHPTNPVEHLSRAISELGVQVVGVSLYSQAIKSTMRQLAWLKQRHPDISVIVGGPHPSEAIYSLLGLSFVDYAVRGEAETCFPDLVERLLQGERPVGEIPGVYRRDPETGGIVGTSGSFVDLEALDDTGDLTYKLRPSEHLHYKRFRGAHGLVGPRYWPLSIVRGCPYACTFCAAKVMSGKKLRHRDVNHVADELAHYRTVYGQRHFSIVDDALFQDFEYLYSLCKTLIARNLDIEWTTDNGIRYESLGASRHLQRFLEQTDLGSVDRLIELLLDAGWRGTSIGIESGAPRVRRELVRKGGVHLENDEIASSLALLKRLARKRGVDFYINGYLMTGFPPLVLPNGKIVPAETNKEAQETYDFALSLQEQGVLDFVNLSIAIPLPGTDLWDHLSHLQRIEILLANFPKDHPEAERIRNIRRELAALYTDTERTRYSDEAECAFWTMVYQLSDDAQIEINGAYDAFNADAAYRIDLDRPDGSQLFQLRQALLENFYGGFRKELKLMGHIYRRSEGVRDFMIYFSYFCRTYMPNMKVLRSKTIVKY